jgi:lysozyme
VAIKTKNKDSSGLKALLLKHEGYRKTAYDDVTGRSLNQGDVVEGKVTIGVGRNITDTGITLDEAMVLLKHDIQDATKKAAKYRGFESMNTARQAVIVSMVFNMGSIDSFRLMRQAMAVKDWTEAVHQMKDSKWATQIGSGRLEDLTEMMRTGSWPTK